MIDSGSSGLEVTVERRDGQLHIAPCGEVDLSTSPALRRALQGALAEGAERVVIDLAGIPYMDSSGVATLVEALQTCKRQGRDLVLARPCERVASIFVISKLDTVFTIEMDPGV